MKFSIVTISFNQAQFLEKAIGSVVEQRRSGADVEYIVVDPGSTDGSRKIIERNRTNIDHVVYDQDSGPADGLNNGFALASGEVFGYLNADDMYLPNALNTVSHASRRFSQSEWVLLLDGFALEASGAVRPIVADRFNTYMYAHDSCVIFQPGSFLSRATWEKSGPFNVNNRTCWDAELLVRAALGGSVFANHHRPVAVFRRHPDAISTSITGATTMADDYRGDRLRLARMILGRDPGSLSTRVFQQWSRVSRAGHLLSHQRLKPDVLL